MYLSFDRLILHEKTNALTLSEGHSGFVLVADLAIDLLHLLPDTVLSG